MSEQLSSFEQQREALVEKLKLREQYEQQIKTLNETGVLEILPDSHELGIIGIDGKPYPISKYEEILSRITPEKIELLTKKFEQGFTKLLLVPFAMPLDTLIDRYRRELLKHDSEGTFISTYGKELKLNREHPIHTFSETELVDLNQGLFYEPQRFSKNHHGKAKIQIIHEGSPWQIVLVEDMVDLPAEGQGKTITGRHQFEANKSAIEYLKLLQTDPNYLGELGFNYETWLTLVITYLHNQNIQIDTLEETRGKSCLLIGSVLPYGGVPYACWHLELQDCIIDYNDSVNINDRDADESIRTRVEI
jgi:hypothetical protein